MSSQDFAAGRVSQPGSRDQAGGEGDSPSTRVAQRLIDTLPALIERLGVMYRAEVEEYARLPDQDLDREVLQVTRSVLVNFFHAVAAGQAPVVDDRLGMVELGRRRMEMGVSLDAMLHIFRINARGVFNALVECVEPGEEAALGVIGSQWLDYLDLASSSAAISYLHASHNRVVQIEARAIALVEAILAVNDAAEAAAVGAEFSVHLADSFVPCCLPTSTRRDAVSAVAPAGSLLSSRADVLLVLVPGSHSAGRWLDSCSDVPVASYGRNGRLGPELRAEVARAEVLLRIR